MKRTENIEQLFKETFENLEADVNPNAWANVQSGMSSSAGGAASAAAKFAVGKMVAGAIGVVVVAGGIWYAASNKEEKTNAGSPAVQTQPEMTTASAEKENPITANSSPSSLSNSHASKQTASPTPVSSEQGTAGEHKQESSSSHSEDGTVPENTVADPSSTAPAVHKYGNAPQGDGGMMRWNRSGNPSSGNAAANHSAEEAEDAEEAQSVKIFVSTTSGDAPLTVDFLNQGVASGLIWDFGDGKVSRENAVSHTFEKAGIYEVVLSAKNTSGQATDKITIEVKPISSITTIPNIFTPNGDGENDVLNFEMKNIASIGVVIFSQKYGTVAQWNVLDGSWNGKLMNGQDAPEGIYFYTIQANGTDGMFHQERGTVTLKRQ